MNVISVSLGTQANVYVSNNEQPKGHFCKVNVGMCLASSTVGRLPHVSNCSAASGLTPQEFVTHGLVIEED